jgi:chemotaxis protein methyltransferase CheR
MLLAMDALEKKRISDKQFEFLTSYLSSKYGLRIPPEKRVLLESRLNSRLNMLNIPNVEEYLKYTFNPATPNDEYLFFVEQITTHKTFFFRENYQFNFLSNLLDTYMATLASNRPLSVWSAGCSTGEEVYTIGMILNEKKSEIPHLDYRIVGTDISVPSLKKAAQGVYTNELENLPESFRQKYFANLTEDGKPTLRFQNAEISSKIQLGVLNLNRATYNLPNTFDFIFCRNVTIYFSAKTREEVLGRIIAKLRPGGYLFLGHSETALGMTLPIKSIKPTIYQKI